MTMDATGKIIEANAAAAVALNVPLVHLVGKPLLTFVQDADRGDGPHRADPCRR